MTIEEKAKAYDEVLERVKPLYEWAKKDDSPMWSTYEYLFPQLAESESEDERIRKEIIEVLRFVPSSMWEQAKTNYERCFAYLEKQKSKDDEEKYLDGIKRDWFERGKKEVLTVPELYGLEKQKEQKPVEVKDPFSNANFVRGYESGYADAKREQKPDTRDSDDLQLLGFIYDLLNEIEWKDDWAMSKEKCLRLLSNYRPQKPVSDCHDLEEEVKRYLCEECSGDDEPAVSEIARHFAEWQKAKMMKGVVECVVCAGMEGDKWIMTYIGSYESMLKTCKAGDKVRIIIVKEDNNGH